MHATVAGMISNAIFISFYAFALELATKKRVHSNDGEDKGMIIKCPRIVSHL